MAVGTVSPGQKLTPDPNMLAAVRVGGDVWGANGGGAVAVGGGATDQTGYVKPPPAVMSDCELATNYIVPARLPQTASAIGRESNGALLTTQPTALSPNGNNAG